MARSPAAQTALPEVEGLVLLLVPYVTSSWFGVKHCAGLSGVHWAAGDIASSRPFNLVAEIINVPSIPLVASAAGA